LEDAQQAREWEGWRYKDFLIEQAMQCWKEMNKRQCKDSMEGIAGLFIQN
jgi:hypothetical protein